MEVDKKDFKQIFENRKKLISLLEQLNDNDGSCTEEAILECFRASPTHSMADVISIIKDLRSSYWEPSSTIPPRSYQIELIRRVIDSMDNYIIFLPTGSGKTLISSIIMKYMIDQYIGKHVIFLANTVALLNQQHKAFIETTKFPQAKTAVCYGGHIDRNVSKGASAIFCVPTVYRQLLDNRTLYMHHASMIIFDEAHHARKDHPYATIMRDCWNEELAWHRPQILGLTASPGEGDSMSDAERSISLLCRTLNSQITMPLEEKSVLDLEKVTAIQSTIVEEYTPSPLDKDCASLIIEHLHHCLNLYINQELLDLGKYEHSKLMDPEYSMMSRLVIQSNNESIISSRRNLIEEFRDLLSIYPSVDLLGTIAAQLIITLERIMDITARSCLLYHLIHYCLSLCELLEELEDFGNYAVYEQILHLMNESIGISDHTMLQIHHNLAENWEEAKRNTLVQIESKIGSKLTKAQSQGKVSVLRKCIDEMIKSSKMNPHSNSNAIVFVQTRATAVKVSHYLDKHYPSLGCKHIIGRSEMSSNAQLTTAREFNEGVFKILVATSVVEEGIDIQSCDVVVRMDGTQTAKSFIQSRGRARKMSSKYYLIVSSGDGEQVNSLIRRELFMIKAVKKMCDPNRSHLEDYHEIAQLEVEAARSSPSPQSISSLNEYCQKNRLPPPEYSYQENPNSFARFICTCEIDWAGVITSASASTKHEAKIKAVHEAWNKIQAGLSQTNNSRSSPNSYSGQATSSNPYMKTSAAQSLLAKLRGIGR